MNWFTIADRDAITDLWTDASQWPDDALSMLLDAARDQCEKFAPVVAPDAVPPRYRLAQVLQARDIAQAGTFPQGGGDPEAAYAMPVYPMSWTIKNLLRPRRGVPKVH